MTKVDLIKSIKALENSQGLKVSFREVLAGIRTSYEDFENLSVALIDGFRAASQGVPVDDSLQGYDSIVRLKSFYFLFCQNVLQLYSMLGDGYPGYQRIKFFRDKIVVHWSDYVGNDRELHQMMAPAFPIQDDLFVPFFMRQVFFTANEVEKDVIFDEVNRLLRSKGKASVNFCKAFDVGKIHEQYYSVLESVDPTYDTFLKWGKNNDLVRALYAWCFPPPFLSMRKYLEDLVLFLEAPGKFPV